MFKITGVKTLHTGFANLLEVTRSDDRKREVLDVQDSVAFLVHNQDNDTLILVSQFREPVALKDEPSSGLIVEVPAGHLKEGKSVKTTVVEEAWEELRIKITENMIRLVTGDVPLFLSPGILTERMHLAYVVIKSENIHGPDGIFGLEEEGEFTKRVAIPINGLDPLTLRDMKTYALVMWFHYMQN